MNMFYIITFIIATGIASVSAYWIGVSVWDIVTLALVLAPLGVVGKYLLEEEKGIVYTGSIIFRKYNLFFRVARVLLSIILLIGLYQYAQSYDWITMLLVLVSAVLVQSPYYALIKKFIPSEVLLIPLSVVGLVLFIYF